MCDLKCYRIAKLDKVVAAVNFISVIYLINWADNDATRCVRWNWFVFQFNCPFIASLIYY